MVAVDKDAINDSQVLVVTENGYGKRTKLVDEDGEDVYRIQIAEVKELRR
jgi:DNA gyrase subunit A